jgi:hypothetical protein
MAIAGRLKAKLEPDLLCVSRDTIEEYMGSAHGRQVEYELKLLATRKLTLMTVQRALQTENGSEI